MQGIVTIKEALEMTNTIFVDVRSENEYNEDHIPGAINLPIFNNEERAELGTIYKNLSIEEAKMLGLKIVAPKLPRLYEEMLEYKDKKIILYCWRGGMRSKSLHSILHSVMGLNASRLEGGYKAYRRFVNDFFEKDFSQEVVVLHGLTGVGKTELIQKLKLMNINALDLEGLANNRGSSYGNVAMPEQPSQKLFETKIFSELWPIKHDKYVIMECESKRIGRVFMPNSLFNSMKIGKHILIHDTLANRINRIIAEYAKHFNQEIVKQQLLTSTSNLQQRLGKKVVADLQHLILENDLKPVVEYLLVKYYDPLYDYPDAPSQEYDLSVYSGDQDQAVRQIADYINSTYL